MKLKLLCFAIVLSFAAIASAVPGDPLNQDACWVRLQTCNASCIRATDVNACAYRCGVAFGECFV